MPESVSESASVLVVAHQTAATAALLDAVRDRAKSGPARFHLVVPRHPHGMHKVVDPVEADEHEAQVVLDEALPKLSQAAGTEVTGSVGDPEPLMAINKSPGDARFLSCSTKTRSKPSSLPQARM